MQSKSRKSPACSALVFANSWRLFFEFRDGNVYLLDYDDYH
jgi:toxin HigB-1